MVLRLCKHGVTGKASSISSNPIKREQAAHEAKLRAQWLLQAIGEIPTQPAPPISGGVSGGGLLGPPPPVGFSVLGSPPPAFAGQSPPPPQQVACAPSSRHVSHSIHLCCLPLQAHLGKRRAWLACGCAMSATSHDHC